jgi:hypothetical protein
MNDKSIHTRLSLKKIQKKLRGSRSLFHNSIYDATAMTLFFHQQAEKSLGLLRIKLQKLTFCKNAIYLYKKICFLFILAFGFSLFSQSCQQSKKKQIYLNPNYRLTIYVGEKNVKMCLHSILISNPNSSKTCSDVYEDQIPCMTHPTEIPLFSMNPKDAADIAFKGISEIQIKNPKIGRKIEKLVIFSIDSKENKTKDAQLKFEKELETLLKSSKIESIVKRLDTESTSKLLYESAIQDFPLPDDSFFYLYTGENILHFHKIKNKSIQSQVHDELGYDLLFELGENYRKEFFSCRQIISPALGTFHSGWENFEDCRKFISNRMKESKTKPFFEKATSDEQMNLYVIGGIWTDISLFFSKSTLSREEIKKSIRNTCKITTVELLNKNYNKNISYKLCYNLSYADSILNLLKVDSLIVLPESNLSSSGAIFSAFFPECAAPNQPSLKKK